ncbi:hypothetical protein D3C78_1560000 [compost metagenome]
MFAVCKPVFSYFFVFSRWKTSARNLPDWSVNDVAVGQCRGFATDGVFTGEGGRARKEYLIIVYNFTEKCLNNPTVVRCRELCRCRAEILPIDRTEASKQWDV